MKEVHGLPTLQTILGILIIACLSLSACALALRPTQDNERHTIYAQGCPVPVYLLNELSQTVTTEFVSCRVSGDRIHLNGRLKRLSRRPVWGIKARAVLIDRKGKALAETERDTVLSISGGRRRNIGRFYLELPYSNGMAGIDLTLRREKR